MANIIKQEQIELARWCMTDRDHWMHRALLLLWVLTGRLDLIQQYDSLADDWKWIEDEINRQKEHKSC